VPRRFWPLTLLLLTVMLLCAASVIAAGADPGVYLTANLIAGAATYIDAAIGDFGACAAHVSPCASWLTMKPALASFAFCFPAFGVYVCWRDITWRILVYRLT